MTGLVRRTGGSVRIIRTSIEVTVLVTGWLLGGTVGLGTVVYAVSIGPLLHRLLPLLAAPGVQAATGTAGPGVRAGRVAIASVEE
jgi:uncharacterized membrane protein YczE